MKFVMKIQIRSTRYWFLGKYGWEMYRTARTPTRALRVFSPFTECGSEGERSSDALRAADRGHARNARVQGAHFARVKTCSL